MLNQEIIQKIEEFVYSQPRSTLEIAEHIKKNWRTADRYIEEISTQFGRIKTRTFRGGTRGALKIVYWNLNEKVSKSIFQEELEKNIFNSIKKEDFSAFDIFEQIIDKNKKVTVEKKNEEIKTNLKELDELIKETKKQLILFSGNLSWLNLKDKEINFLDSIEELIKKGVQVKVICDVNLTGKENIEKMLSLNFKTNKEAIEIRHKKQPLRAIIFDDKKFRIKEVLEPTGKINELNKKTFIFYTIKDKEWTDWLTKVFYKMFNQGTSAKKRLEELNKIYNKQ
jgi:hypothetical protein